jgi:hypothetical protein
MLPKVLMYVYIGMFRVRGELHTSLVILIRYCSRTGLADTITWYSLPTFSSETLNSK